MDIQKVYISFDGDHIGRKIGLASLSDSPDEIRRISQAIERGNEIWRSWAIVVGGDVISLGGDEGRIAVNADHIADLPAIQAKYESAVEATVSVGVGLKLSEADKALLASKLHGGNRITFFTPEIDEELKEIQAKHQESEESKIYDAYLDKAEHPLQGQFEQIIQEQLEAESQQQAEKEKSTQTGQMKQQVVAILQQVRANTKELEGLKQEAPHLYQSIMSLVQALIMMGRQLQTPQIAPQQTQPMAKSEPAAMQAKHFVMQYPIGFMLAPGGDHKGGRIKVATSNGKTKWHSVRSGIVMGPDGGAVSSRNPKGGAGT